MTVRLSKTSISNIHPKLLIAKPDRHPIWVAIFFGPHAPNFHLILSFIERITLSAEISTPEKDVQAPQFQTESHLRSILKALSWRFVATFTTIMIAWFFTGEVDTALKVGGG